MTKYSYTITPLLAPFNKFFFVKTDNPNPGSFSFVDKSTKYGEYAEIRASDRNYADINYENSETRRVSGGYIFSCYFANTDGGEIVLKSKTGETNLKYTLPALKDDVDYLIDTYGSKSGYFDKMDEIERGLRSIALYSGSYIRGKFYNIVDYWHCPTLLIRISLFTY